LSRRCNDTSVLARQGTCPIRGFLPISPILRSTASPRAAAQAVQCGTDARRDAHALEHAASRPSRRRRPRTFSPKMGQSRGRADRLPRARFLPTRGRESTARCCVSVCAGTHQAVRFEMTELSQSDRCLAPRALAPKAGADGCPQRHAGPVVSRPWPGFTRAGQPIAPLAGVWHVSCTYLASDRCQACLTSCDRGSWDPACRSCACDAIVTPCSRRT
jgi:hypothetical protein